MMEDSLADSSLSGEQRRLLVFDLDGMLDDARSLRVHSFAQALSQLALEKGLDIDVPNPAALQVLSMKIEEILDLLGPQLSKENLAHLLDLVQEAKRSQVESGNIRLHPEILEALALLRDLGYRMAILSLDSRDYMLAVIDYFELDRYIDISVCSSDFGGPNPSLGLLEIVDNQEILKSEAVYISNRSEGLVVARELGIVSVGCQWGGVSPEELQSADEVVESPGELVELLFPTTE